MMLSLKFLVGCVTLPLTEVNWPSGTAQVDMHQEKVYIIMELCQVRGLLLPVLGRQACSGGPRSSDWRLRLRCRVASCSIALPSAAGCQRTRHGAILCTSSRHSATATATTCTTGCVPRPSNRGFRGEEDEG